MIDVAEATHGANEISTLVHELLPTSKLGLKALKPPPFMCFTSDSNGKLTYEQP